MIKVDKKAGGNKISKAMRAPPASDAPGTQCEPLKPARAVVRQPELQVASITSLSSSSRP
eukprot:3547788-Rhodomonas_salina.2